MPETSTTARVLASFSPSVVIAMIAFGIPLALSGRHALLSAYGILALAVALLCGSALLLVMYLFPQRSAQLSFAVALVTALAVWAWQRITFNLIIPNGFLTYGYFLTNEGQRARTLLLEIPIGVGSALLVCSLGVAVVASWRTGTRWLILPAFLWWFTLFIAFGLPYLYWSIQGDASVFI